MWTRHVGQGGSGFPLSSDIFQDHCAVDVGVGDAGLAWRHGGVGDDHGGFVVVTMVIIFGT